MDSVGFKVKRFPKTSTPALRLTQPPIQGSFSGGKAAGTWGWLPISILCQAYKWEKLYFLFPYVLSWHVQEHLPDVNISCFVIYNEDLCVACWIDIWKFWHTCLFSLCTLSRTKIHRPDILYVPLRQWHVVQLPS